jgi:hypothetical protein
VRERGLFTPAVTSDSGYGTQSHAWSVDSPSIGSDRAVRERRMQGFCRRRLRRPAEPGILDVTAGWCRGFGDGPGGEVAASRLLEAGRSVAVVERELIGGECAYWGCTPSKTLIGPVEVRRAAGRVAGLGEPDLTWAEVAAGRLVFSVSKYTNSTHTDTMAIQPGPRDVIRGDGFSTAAVAREVRASTRSRL